MGWFDRLRRYFGMATPDESLDVESGLAEGLRDRRAARQAIARLKREQRTLIRQRQVLDKQLRRLTSGRVKAIGRSTSANYAIPGEMLRQAMQEAGDAGQTQAGILQAE